MSLKENYFIFVFKYFYQIKKQVTMDVVNLRAQDFANKIISDESAVVIDVRTPREFIDGHIPNSILIDIYNPIFQEKVLSLDKTKNYYIYCRSGSRSYNAGMFMLSKGFSNVHHLADGIICWIDKLETGL